MDRIFPCRRIFDASTIKCKTADGTAVDWDDIPNKRPRMTEYAEAYLLREFILAASLSKFFSDRAKK